MPDEARGELSDADGLARAAAGDARAFGVLVERHQHAVLRLSRWLTGSESAAEDVLQETFLAAFRHAASFRGEASVRTWLLALARGKAREARHRRAGEPVQHEPLAALGQAAGWGDPADPEHQLADAERRRTLLRAIDALAEADREVLLLRDLEGLTGAEAAEMLGLTLAALKTRLHRARLKLMAELRKEGCDGT